MPIPGQNFCPSCMRPVRTPGKCNNCMAKEMKVVKTGNYCDHCRKNATNTLLYINKKTKSRYCPDCRAVFRDQLVAKGFEPKVATKIMLQDFVLINDPLRKHKKRKT